MVPVEYVLVWAASVAVFGAIGGWLYRFWTRGRDVRERRETEAFLARKGYYVYSYSPTIGTELEDDELAGALLRATAGYRRVVLDDAGNLVGGVLPRLVRSDLGGGPREKHLRLVVSNTEPPSKAGGDGAPRRR